MQVDEETIRRLAEQASTREEFWTAFLNAAGVESVVEIGVYRGGFAAAMLAGCESLRRYYLVDPWRHLASWNKPANKDDDTFEEFYQETLRRTDPYQDKRVVLRGTTTEVIDEIADGELDFAYVDGDHTLRGITIDLIRVYPKVREGGWIGGDDLARALFQHEDTFEPTFVFPYAVYFAEAVGARIYALGNVQFLMQKTPKGEHAFIDLTGRYPEPTVARQIKRRVRRVRQAQRRAAQAKRAEAQAAEAQETQPQPEEAQPEEAQPTRRRGER